MTIVNTAWAIDGTSLVTKAYYVVNGIEESTPKRRGENPILPGRSGRQYVSNKPFDERPFTLLMVIDAQPTGGGTRTAAQLKANLDYILKLFTVDGQRILTRTQSTSQMQATVELRQLRIVEAGPYHYNVAAEMIMADPFWYSTTKTTVEGKWSASVTVVNNGTYKVEKAFISILGPVVNPRLTVGSSWVQFTGTVPSTKTLVLDCAAYTAELDGVSIVKDITWADGYTRWLEIFWGTSTLYASGTGTDENTKLTLEFYEVLL